MVITILDSGYSGNAYEKVIGGVSIEEKDGKILYKNEYLDTSGHGTAVTDLLLSQCEDDVKVYVIRILDGEERCSSVVLLNAFLFILEKVECDLIHISAGVESLYEIVELKNVISKLYDKKIYVVAAYANNGSVSYPAAFDNVVGIDMGSRYIKKNQYEYVEGSIINFRTSSNCFRVNWNGRQMILNGSSFSSTLISAKVAQIISKYKIRDISVIMDMLKGEACYVHEYHYFPRLTSAEEIVRQMNKAIVVPFNKEMFQIAGNEELCDFEVVGYYSFKYDMSIGKKICQVLKYSTNEKKVCSIETINWEGDFDTVILGHCNEIEYTIQKDITAEILNQANRHNKRVYSLANITKYIKDYPECAVRMAFPYVDISCIPQNRFGKLRKTSKPLIAVCGTSSRQGKFHVQLELRRRFLSDGYQVFQISSEPTGYLFGMDYVYPIGYESTVYLSEQDAVLTLNDQLGRADNSNVDLILVGSQSGTIPFQYNNISQLTIQQTEFLMALNPDAVHKVVLIVGEMMSRNSKKIGLIKWKQCIFLLWEILVVFLFYFILGLDWVKRYRKFELFLIAILSLPVCILIHEFMHFFVIRLFTNEKLSLGVKRQGIWIRYIYIHIDVKLKTWKWILVKLAPIFVITIIPTLIMLFTNYRSMLAYSFVMLNFAASYYDIRDVICLCRKS